MLSACCRLTSARRGRGESGIVAANLALTIAFALFAVIELSRVTLAAKQIKQRVRTITTEVGPGSNVSRLDETKILDNVADTADQILVAAKPLSGQANEILATTKTIDATAVSILGNAQSINGTVHSINGTFQTLAPVVDNIHGTPGTPENPAPADIGGVQAINTRVENIYRNVVGVRTDLDQVNTDVQQINASAAGIDAFVNNILGNPLGTVTGLTCAVLHLLC